MWWFASKTILYIVSADLIYVVTCLLFVVTTERNKMFVVIQEIKLKKHNQNGAYKEYQVSSSTFHFNGISKTSYNYYPNYDEGRFERPHLEAYKISLHHSYRENGKIKKKQCVIGTIGYYILADDKCEIYDYLCTGMDKADSLFELADNYPLYDLIMEKLEPIKEMIQAEFQQSEEYKANKEHDELLKIYRKSKAEFAEKYQVEENEYDCCYNVFGELMNKDYLDKIIANYKYQEEYAKSSYHNYNSSNYNYSGYSGYHASQCSNYNDQEKQTLKQFYKELSKKFHPDLNPDTDTTRQMQLLNKLKGDWGL